MHSQCRTLATSVIGTRMIIDKKIGADNTLTVAVIILRFYYICVCYNSHSQVLPRIPSHCLVSLVPSCTHYHGEALNNHAD